MTYDTILLEEREHACVITMNRPDRRNAVSLKMMEEIAAAAIAAEGSPSARGVIITGGSKFFSAGADLNEALQVKTVSQGFVYAKAWQTLNNTLETLGKPVLAAIEGFCMTGGCEMALACDIRIAGEGSSFAITSARIGTLAGAGGTQRLPRIVGLANALELLFSAETIDTAEAHRIGLINRRTPQGGALDEALRMCAVYAERGPISLALMKRAVRRGLQSDQTSGLDLEASLFTAIYTTDDKQEGISAFLEKRKAAFRGR